MDEATLRRIHLQGYISAVNAGVGTIMPSYSSWNGVKVSGIKHLLTDILKDELGFEGFLISDYNAIDQIDKRLQKGDRNLHQRRHGHGDGAEPLQTIYRQSERARKRGTVPMARIDDAVTRILRVKFAMGLLDPNRSPTGRPQPGHDIRLAGTPASGARGRAAVAGAPEESGMVLPLAKTAARIHVAGKNADDLGNQCGGWTIDWQGKAAT